MYSLLIVTFQLQVGQVIAVVWIKKLTMSVEKTGRGVMIMPMMKSMIEEG
jgi:hypothetical protein